VLVSHNWPSGASSNSVLASHDADYPGGGGGSFSAILNTTTGVLTISNGSGFGSKSPAAPIFFQPFVGLTNGISANHASIGFDFNYSNGTHVVNNSVGPCGNISGSLEAQIRCADHSRDDWYLQTGIDFATGQTEVFVSMWTRVNHVAGTLAQAAQMKGIRTGRDDGSGGRYGTLPRLAGSTWLGTSGEWRTTYDQASYLAYFDSAGTEVGNFTPNHDPDVVPYLTVNSSGESIPYGNSPFTGYGQWWNTEIHHKLNDYGSANGFMRLYLNGQLRASVTHTQPVTTSGHNLGWVNFGEIFDHTDGLDANAFMSRIYVDNTPARVFLGNSATLAGCTGHFMLEPTAWADGAITANLATTSNAIPSGYAYLYAFDASGNQVALNGSTNGYAYSTTS
jgi:hypothetical protein